MICPGCAGMQGVVHVKGNASIAAHIDGDRQGEQFFGLGIQHAGGGAGLVKFGKSLHGFRDSLPILPITGLISLRLLG